MQQLGYNTETARMVFLTIGLTLLLFSPLIVVLVPMFIPITFYFEKYTWVYYTPTSSYKLYIAGTIMIIIACMIFFFFNIKKWTVSINTFLFLIAFFLYYTGGVSFMKMSQEGISFRNPFELSVHEYTWSDMETVRYFPLIEFESGRPIYEVTFNDGNIYKFEETEHILIARANMLSMLEIHDVEYENMHSYKSKLYDQQNK